jgi:hypothetical protein
VKKAITSSCCHLFFLLWSFWFSSLELIINNKMVIFLNVEGCIG